MTATTRNTRRHLQGVVKSAKPTDTITVIVEQVYKHPKYGKYLRKHKKYLVHDGGGEAQEGDTVEIAASRPLSKRKRWRLVKVLQRSRFGDEGGQL